MVPSSTPSPSPTGYESSDIFSLTDKQLSDKYQFVEECGAGNYGSVWIANERTPKNAPPGLVDNKLAIKVVHRSKTQTTAARVRSLWNEMKIIRPLKNDSHPSIVNFHSFIITPSYALITMEYLPRLIPVEVDERKGREWFKCLASAVEYLHKRGVVHNDIKPANILLSTAGVPVFVDFGFAEKYNPISEKAFLSTLAYGTPEYLSPERARGLTHDTRKADVWSLGITMFEILVGRTPFESEEGEHFATKDDLEKYWQRTLKGKWLGKWRISHSAEKLLKKMICPNADLRITATHVMLDPYFNPSQVTTVPATPNKVSKSSHIDVSSPALRTPTLAASGISATVSKNKDISVNKELLPSTPSTPLKVHPKSLPLRNRILEPLKEVDTPASSPKRRVERAASNRKLLTPSSKDKENMVPGAQPLTRRTTRKPVPSFHIPKTPPAMTDSSAQKEAKTRRTLNLGKVLADMTPSNGNKKRTSSPVSKILEPEAANTSTQISATADPTLEETADNYLLVPTDLPANSSLFRNETFPRSKNESGLSILQQMRVSVEKTVNRLGGASTGGRLSNVSASAAEEPQERSASVSARESWEDDAMMRSVKSSLPVVRNAIRDEQIAAENRLDRMAIWIRNVEKVVEDARTNFAKGGGMTPLPPFPPRVAGPSNPRRAVPKDTAETEVVDPGPRQRPRRATVSTTTPEIKVTKPDDVLEGGDVDSGNESGVNASPNKSRHKGKSKSQSDIMSNIPIRPISKLQYELERGEMKHPVRLSTLFDAADARKQLITEPQPPRMETSINIPPITTGAEMATFDKPPKSPVKKLFMHTPSAKSGVKPTASSPIVTPTGSLRASTGLPVDPEAGVYEKFLMATANVKRVGQGYQSAVRQYPSIQNKSFMNSSRHKGGVGKFFNPARRDRASLDNNNTRRTSISMDDFGATYIHPSATPVTPSNARSKNPSFVRRALNAISVGNTLKHSRRLSQVY